MTKLYMLSTTVTTSYKPHDTRFTKALLPLQSRYTSKSTVYEVDRNTLAPSLPPFNFSCPFLSHLPTNHCCPKPLLSSIYEGPRLARCWSTYFLPTTDVINSINTPTREDMPPVGCRYT
mmetsp:Transcript_30768/g.98969  ORF Transcript_30768/g.98969 Transcript_30768/m.98969 type:complete len:119 (-) Transcript_30768:398-754(-)